MRRSDVSERVKIAEQRPTEVEHVVIRVRCCYTYVHDDSARRLPTKH